jgi:hypothetical protein
MYKLRTSKGVQKKMKPEEILERRKKEWQADPNYSIPVKEKLKCQQCENDKLRVYLVKGGLFLICTKLDCGWSWGRVI